MRKFIGWLRERISGSDTPISEYLQKLAHHPIFTVVTYQGYDINGYMFYTKHQDKKEHIRIVLYVLMLMMSWVKTKLCTIAN
jgi:energy-converting hydrogenase Eha subunit F